MRKFWAITRTRGDVVGYITVRDQVTTFADNPMDALLVARRQDAEAVLSLIGGRESHGLAVTEIDEPLTLEMQVQEPSKKRKRAPNDTEHALQMLARKVWGCYHTAYQNRYGTEPVRNAKQNALVLAIAKRLGEDAPDVVGSYIGSQDSFYARSWHSLDLMLRDAEKLHSEWRTGKRVTVTQAQRNDASASNPFVGMIGERRRIA